MTLKIKTRTLSILGTQTNGLAFIPSKEVELKPVRAIFTHGYTSHKGSILNWAARLAEEGVPSYLFDVPGHYLGNYSEVDDFEAFKREAPNLFSLALQDLNSFFPEHSKDDLKVILGGHSMGALLSLKAAETEFFQLNKPDLIICVGFGLPPKGITHVFDTPFYKSTLILRGQLVCPTLSPEVVFPWIKEEKENLKVSGLKIHLLSGEDDMVVGKNGTESLMEILERNHNQVTIEKPPRLAHHLPEQAAPHIKKYLKDLGFFS